MLTTPELRGKFEISFSRLISTLSPDQRKKWDGLITWKDNHSFPEVQAEMIQGFTPAAKAMYVSLLNNLSRGKL